MHAKQENSPLLKRNAITRHIQARPRLFIACIIGVFTAYFFNYFFTLHPATLIIVGWNTLAFLYLAMSGFMMLHSTHQDIHRRALLQDEGRFIILIMVIVAVIVSLAAIVAELGMAKNLHGFIKYVHIALAGLTIFSSWAFTHLMFALHYAHDFFLAQSKKMSPGLSFPDEQNPDYLDFLYFSFVIGTSGQTADVSFTSKPMRRLGLLHCVLSFLFNTTLLALTINIAASLI